MQSSAQRISSMYKDEAGAHDKLENKENSYPVKSTGPHKRAKVMLKGKNLGGFELRIPVATKKTTIGRLNRIESGQVCRLGSLNRSIEKVRQEIGEYSTRIMTLQTHKANYELELYKTNNHILKQRENLNFVESQIEELKFHQEESVQEISRNHEVKRKAITAAHEELVSSLTAKYTKEAEQLIYNNLKHFKDEKIQLLRQCEELNKEIKSLDLDLNRKLIKLKEEHSFRLSSEKKDFEDRISSFKKESQSVDIQIEEKQNELHRSRTRLLEQDEKLKDVNSKLQRYEAQLKSKDEELNLLEYKNLQLEEQIRHKRDIFRARVEEIDRLLAETKQCKEEWVVLEHRRRILHGRLQDLKGNIRVFCRIRPGQVPGVNSGTHSIDIKEASFNFQQNGFNLDAKIELEVSKEPLSENSTTSNSLYNGAGVASNRFQFDHIISSSTKNLEIFEELSQLVQSSLDGYNVCIFAYGQTGSGKTWTMSHPQDGMIPLSIKKIFADMEEQKQKNWEFSLSGQFLEIYNENVVDLLSTLLHVKLEIKHDDSTFTTVANASFLSLKSEDQVMKTLQLATKNRSTASTKSNERSSRSHSIYRFYIESINTKTGEKRQGTLNLVDLAGSERISNSQVTGDRLKETQAINKSLSSLGDVIHALGQKKVGHIPYRNSKLTYLLKNSLGGNAKVLMIVNVSPLLKNYGETINSLRFASKVNSTKPGR